MIYVLDTNVVSELMKLACDPQVATFVDSLDPNSIFVTAITLAEIRYGLARLPNGKRKADFEMAADGFFSMTEKRTLSFTPASALEYASIASNREVLGRPISTADAMIAAICAETKATLVTRNTKNFDHIQLPIVNPWLS
jgi:toxin FitB